MKNFVIEFSNEWTLYRYDEQLNNLPDETSKYLKNLININVDKEAYYLNDNPVSIAINWDNIDETGKIELELDNYKDEIKIKSFLDFVEKMGNLDGIVDNFKMNVSDWQAEEKDPYGSRGLTIRDFI